MTDSLHWYTVPVNTSTPKISIDADNFLNPAEIRGVGLNLPTAGEQPPTALCMHCHLTVFLAHRLCFADEEVCLGPPHCACIKQVPQHV